MKSPIPLKATIVVELRVDLARAQAQDRRVQVHVLAPAEVGVEAGSEFEQGGHPAARRERVPVVGETMPPMSLSSVLLPEPLGPSRPTVVPASIVER